MRLKGRALYGHWFFSTMIGLRKFFKPRYKIAIGSFPCPYNSEAPPQSFVKSDVIGLKKDEVNLGIHTKYYEDDFLPISQSLNFKWLFT